MTSIDIVLISIDAAGLHGQHIAASEMSYTLYITDCHRLTSLLNNCIYNCNINVLHIEFHDRTRTRHVHVIMRCTEVQEQLLSQTLRLKDCQILRVAVRCSMRYEILHQRGTGGS